MEGFLCGAFLALASKCDLLDRELKSFQPTLAIEGFRPARRLALRGHEMMRRNKGVAAGYAVTTRDAVEPSLSQRARWWREYKNVAREVQFVEQKVVPFLRAFDRRAVA